MPILPKIFIAYAREDAPLLEKLRKPLNVLRRNGHCDIFFDGEIVPGEHWDERLKAELHQADIYLLLVTDDFLDSDYINDVELPKAIEKEKQGKAKVIPIILRPCMWQYTLLKEFQVVLYEGKPIEPSDGYVYAVEQVARVIEERKKSRRLKLEAAKRRAADPFHDQMVSLKGGKFDMGDTFNEGYDTEKPIRKVTVNDFYLCKYPVTQGAWKRIMGERNNPSRFKGDDLPVEQVRWNDAQDFIKKLNKVAIAEGERPYRLPSEAEWEFASREGGKKLRFGNGKDIADPMEVNFDGRKDYKKPYSIEGIYRNKTTPVGSLNCPNAIGLHDMSGNVWEWCQDSWNEKYEGAPTTSVAWEDSGELNKRAVRGGSWNYCPALCRAACRYGCVKEEKNYSIGFRLAR